MSGGKTQTATQQVQIPPEVMARYRAVNTRAETAAAQPFQAYSQDPSAFVAPLTQTQRAGIENINQAAGMTQPYFNTAAGLTMGGAQGVGPLTQQQIQYYQNPFTQSVVGSTLANLQQQQGQQLSQQQAEAIKAGAFGGDRAGIQRAQLQGQQGLATAQAIAPLMMQGYQQGVQTAAGQQAVVAQDLQRQLAAGQQLGGLGAQAQQTALAGAQAQLGAGTAEQQTEQAGKQALYNQFLQERGYPFQVAQFLANIAMGTGALSGSTTATTQAAPFFSDEREKTNVQPLGEGMYAYDYIDDVRRAEEEGRPMPPKRVGPMAQDIEERAPGLVGEVGGHKVVGMNSMGGLVAGPGAYATGGQVAGPEDMRAILAAISQPLAFYGGKGLYGGADKGGVGAAGYVSPASIPVPKLVTAGGLPSARPSGLSEAAQTGSQIAGLAQMGKSALVGSEGAGGKKGSTGLIGSEGSLNRRGYISGLGGGEAGPSRAAPPAPKGADRVADMLPQAEWDANRLFGYRGGLMRDHYAGGGALPYSTGDVGEDPLQKIGDDGDQKYEMLKPASLPAPASSGLGDIVNLAKTAASIYAMSDARMKDNIEQVGELYDGQPIYRYNMKGSPKTQIGLMAQDLEHNGHEDAVAGLGGLKMVDYKRATDVAAGLAGRHGAYRGGYQHGGFPEEKFLLAALPERAEETRATGVVPRLVMSDAEPIERPQVREPGLLVARRSSEEPGTSPVRSDEGPAPGVAPPLPPAREVGAGPSVREVPTGVAPPAATDTGAPPRLLSRESGMSFSAVNPDTGAAGRAQFMASRLEDAKRAGVIPTDMTMTQFLNDKDAQIRTERWHFADVNKFIDNNDLGQYVGTSINGVPVTRNGMVSVAHLGGSGGLKRFLETGGRYNPADANGTRLSDYLAMGATGAPSSARAGAPERVTPGLAGPGRGPMDPASAPFYTLTRRALGMEGEGTPTQKALTSENFWVPALAGIGSMLASRSPFLGVAVGEGLMGGTKAYTDLQGQQQQMGESRARTEGQIADIAQKAFFEYAGRGMVRYLKPDGSYGTMGFADYFSLPRDKRPPVDPRFKDYLEQIEPTYAKPAPGAAAGTTQPPAGAAASTTPPAASAAPGRPVPSEVGATRPSGIPTAVELAPEDRTSAFELARRVSLEGRQSLDERRKNDFFQPQRAAATASQGVIQATLPLAATILSLPRGQSLGTSGPFTQAISPYIAAMNNLVEVATGRIGAVIDPEILASRESVEKEINKIRGQTTSEAGQRAVAALEEMAKSIVSLRNAPEGQRKILAKVLTDTQRNIDKDRWFSQWIEAGSTAPGGQPGVFSDFARLTGQEANQEFDRRYGEPFFAEDRKNLEKMMDIRLGGTTTVGGQPMTVFEYVAKNAAQLPAEQILQLADQFGENTMRYFGIDPNRVRQLRQQTESRRG